MVYNFINISWTKVQFSSPWFLLLLVIPVLMSVGQLKKKEQDDYILFSNLVQVKQIYTWKHGLDKLIPWLRIIIIALLIVALARPKIFNTGSFEEDKGIDIVLSIDVSGSMQAQDFSPNRLEAAKELSEKFVSRREHDRIGLVEFAGESFSLCPVTMDHGMVVNQLKKLQQGLLKDGTSIGMGLATAVDRLKDSKAKSRIIVFLTDGKNTDVGVIGTQLVAPNTAIEIAKTFGIKVYTIGVGTQGMAPMPAEMGGQLVTIMQPVEIDEDLLTQIAKSTGGKYYRAKNNDELNQIYEDIDKLEKSEFDIHKSENSKDVFYIFVLLAFILLLAEIAIRYFIVRRIP